MLYQMMDCPQEEALQPNPDHYESGDPALEHDELFDLDSPTDWDEYEMNADDSFEDPRDPYDMEYGQC